MGCIGAVVEPELFVVAGTDCRFTDVVDPGFRDLQPGETGPQDP